MVIHTKKFNEIKNKNQFNVIKISKFNKNEDKIFVIKKNTRKKFTVFF